MNIQNLTAEEYLDWSVRADANSADKPQFANLVAALKNSPTDQTRLAFDFLLIAWEHPESDLGYSLMQVGSWFRSIPKDRLTSFAALLEAVITRYFRAFCEKSTLEDLTLFFGISMLHDVDPSRCRALIEKLMEECVEKGLPNAREMLESVAQKVQKPAV